jgi:hypothetical protein
LSPTFQIIIALNALFFLFYGLQSLNSKMMIEEFRRFGMSDFQRKQTGILQLLASAGLIGGFLFPYTGLLASAGLSVMMLVAFIVRLKIKDSLLQSLPSFLFMLINTWITFAFYRFIQLAVE